MIHNLKHHYKRAVKINFSFTAEGRTVVAVDFVGDLVVQVDDLLGQPLFFRRCWSVCVNSRSFFKKISVVSV